MGIQRIDRPMWITICAAISANLLGKRAEIEVVSPADGLLTEALRQPVLGIIYDPGKDVLTILLEGIDHFVFQPKEIYLDFSLGGDVSLGILDRANAWQIVLLRDPIMLPRAPAIDARQGGSVP
jgi:hypothetical protein